MSAKLLVYHHCQISFLIKDNSYICLQTSYIKELIKNLLENYEDNFVYEYSGSKEKLNRIKFEWQFLQYLANESRFPNQDVINFSKIESCLLEDIHKEIAIDKKLINFEIKNTYDWDFENTVITVLSLARYFEKNLQVLSQKESNDDVTFFLEWKSSVLEKILVNKPTPKIAFRLFDIKIIKVVDGSEVEFDSLGRKIYFSLNHLVKLTRR